MIVSTLEWTGPLEFLEAIAKASLELWQHALVRLSRVYDSEEDLRQHSVTIPTKQTLVGLDGVQVKICSELSKSTEHKNLTLSR